MVLWLHSITVFVLRKLVVAYHFFQNAKKKQILHLITIAKTQCGDISHWGKNPVL